MNSSAFAVEVRRLGRYVGCVDIARMSLDSGAVRSLAVL